MAVNLAQYQTLAKRMLSLVKLAAERDQAIQGALDEGWEALHRDISGGHALDPAPEGVR